jgi:hypothetical protein
MIRGNLDVQRVSLGFYGKELAIYTKECALALLVHKIVEIASKVVD